MVKFIKIVEASHLNFPLSPSGADSSLLLGIPSRGCSPSGKLFCSASASSSSLKAHLLVVFKLVLVLGLLVVLVLVLVSVLVLKFVLVLVSLLVWVRCLMERMCMVMIHVRIYEDVT